LNKVIKPIVFSISCALFGSAVADDPPVSLHIEAPSSNGGLALLSESGWPISIKLNVELPADETYPAFAVQPDFPVRGSWGFLIFDDPDGCLNPPAPGWLIIPSPGVCGAPDPVPEDWTPPPSDETYLEFWTDVDMAGVEDFAGNEQRQRDLMDGFGGGGPEFDSWDENTNAVMPCTPRAFDPNCDKFGPYTGDDESDGFGIGADDDIPGLVVIAEFGIGKTYDEPNFDPTYPHAARNLAGLVNSVSYDLSDLEKDKKPKGKPGPHPGGVSEYVRIWAHMNMLNLVARNVIQYDACVGNINYDDPPYEDSVVSCDGDELWRIDGGPIQTSPMNFERPDGASIALLESTVFEIRAFLVAGQAPNVLEDENHDGKVDSADAVEAGYTLLSNEDSIEFLQLSQLICFGGGGNAVYMDLDGNGAAIVPIVCGTGPGDLGRPPR